MKPSLWILYVGYVTAEVIFQPQNAANSKNASRSITLDISDLYDNRGFGKEVGDADFNGYHSTSWRL